MHDEVDRRKAAYSVINIQLNRNGFSKLASNKGKCVCESVCVCGSAYSGVFLLGSTEWDWRRYMVC